MFSAIEGWCNELIEQLPGASGSEGKCLGAIVHKTCVPSSPPRPATATRNPAYSLCGGQMIRKTLGFRLLAAKREIAFIDRNIGDLKTLLAGIRPDVEAILLSDDEPAPRQMAQIAVRRPGDGSGLDAIHVIAHGRPWRSQLRLGAALGVTIPLDNLDEHGVKRPRAQRHGRVVRSGALRLWSCATAAGQRGAQFVEMLARVTGMEVAATSGLVGSAARGGNWALENLHVATPAVAPLTAVGQAAYAGTLDTNTATATVTSTTTSNTVSDGSGTNTVTVSSTTGSNTVSDGNGTNTVAVASTTGSNTVSDGNGTDTVTVSGTAGSNDVSDGNGTNTVTVTSTRWQQHCLRRQWHQHGHGLQRYRQQHRLRRQRYQRRGRAAAVRPFQTVTAQIWSMRRVRPATTR